MDHKHAARQILDAIGGPDNVVSAAHCATRLRLVIADNSKVDKDAVDNAEGAKGSFQANGQLQVIFGTGTVGKVYDEFITLGNITAATKAEAKAAAGSQQNKFMAAIKVLSDVFVPIIPAIVASGMLMGAMSAIQVAIPDVDTSSVWWRILALVNACALGNLQILLGFSTATVFGGNPYLGASVGALLISSDFTNAYSAYQGTADVLTVIPNLYSIDWVGYQGHVIPIIVAVWLMCMLEKQLHKHVPDMFDLFVTPLVSVTVTAFVTILIIGPLFVALENGILYVLKWLLSVPLGIGYIVIGLIYSPSVVTGLHQMYTAIDVSMLASYGVTYWLPLASAANIAQGGACLAVALKTKSARTKSLAVPSGISCLLGITEPAIFGVNLPNVKPFVAGMIGSACGAFTCFITNLAAMGTGVTGIFGLLLCISQPVAYIVMFAVSFAVAFGITWVIYSDKKAGAAAEKEALPASAATTAEHVAVPSGTASGSADTVTSVVAETLGSPMAGRAVSLTEVSDPVFASETMGKGAAIIPAEGKVFAPVAGTITVLAESGHVIGMLSDDGCEVLLHIGIDTVNLKGLPFTAHTRKGDKVAKGDLLMDIDLAAIEKAGLDTTTMVIVTNTDSYSTVEARAEGEVKVGDPLVEVR